MGGSKRGLGSVIVCLLVLGLVLKQVQHVEGVDCGGSIFKVACYHSCLLGPSTVFQCADFCGCHLPADLAFVRSSGLYAHGFCPRVYGYDIHDELNTIEYCSLECRSSMCDNMVMVNIGEIFINTMAREDIALSRVRRADHRGGNRGGGALPRSVPNLKRLAGGREDRKAALDTRKIAHALQQEKKPYAHCPCFAIG
ncbi:hypothetical protein TRIUR3_17354 [Triticum urartu]|uniref:Uncharacterized protein n=1 Tax=Triticum urartu TaxID=4572 RepID=M7ZCK7_TRIUA|nr:hypothetical protein TRIUR3_17354 [Triticum urartu]